MKLFFTSLIILSAILLNGQSREKAFEINQKLGRGINYGNMFEAPSETAWGNQWKPEYAGIIADLGFNHVRIPIRWEPANRSLSSSPYTVAETFLNRIKQVVDSALNNGLYAIINMHHHDALFENPDAQKERFLSQWKQISEFFSDYPDSLLFEILNEPHGNLTPVKWNEFHKDALATIREDNPERIVLIGTAEWGGLGGLPSLELPDDENIILTIHYYNPYQFTHQGAEWSGEEAQGWLGTKWLDTDTERDVMRQDFAPLKAYEQRHQVPVHMGEFGAYNKADLQSRVKWTTFLSRYLEELGWSWAYWEFSAGFGIYNPATKTILQPLADALLHNEMPEPGRYAGTPVYTSNFQTTNDGWNLNNQSGASSQLTRADNTLTANITNGGTAGWHIQLVRGNFSLQDGKKYRISFKARADEARSATVYLGMSRDPWSSYSGYNDLSLADTFAVYTYVFDMKGNDNAARFVFDLGTSAVNVSITEIKLEEIVFEPPVSAKLPAAGSVEIYPNPVNDRLFFRNSNEIGKLAIYNLQGQPVIEIKTAGAEAVIDVSQLQPGVYFIRYGEQGKMITRKIIKQ